jgi:hypothetical protein
MDLTTLVIACALGVEPNVTHALVWHQSGGEPWSFAVPGEAQLHIRRPKYLFSGLMQCGCSAAAVVAGTR